MKKIAIFADVQNIYYTTRQSFKKQFNYLALWHEIARKGDIFSAFAYAIDRNDSKQKQFQKTLSEIGFQVKLKPFIQRSDGSAKGDWDVGIVIDMLELAPTIDIAVLLSGDGDFDLALTKLKEKYGVETHVYSAPELTARSLIDAADFFNPIDENLLLP